MSVTANTNSVPQSRRKWLKPPKKYSERWILSRLDSTAQTSWKWPRDIRAALEYHTPRPKLKGEVGVWHNKRFYWVFVIDARHNVVIYRAFIPHPKNWNKYGLNETRWLYVRSLTIPYKDSHEWANGIKALGDLGAGPSELSCARVVRYRDTHIAFAREGSNFCIGAAHYEGIGREFRMSRKRFYWPTEAGPTGFAILEKLLRQQQIAGGLLYMRDGDEIVEVDDWYEDDVGHDEAPQS